MKINIALCLLLAILIPAFSQAKSPKRGICWDEKTQKLSDATVDKLQPGVTWIYTWGEAPQGNAAALGTDKGLLFIPMAWGRNFNETAIREYLAAHKNVKYLLGFNEPNFAAQSAMTPFDAADLWPVLEKIATDFNLKLVAPALNFTGESVGGKVWGIYDWLNDFIGYYKAKRRKLPKIDCLALHCYMNWYSATTWFANDYLYTDIFRDGNDTKYPHIVELLNATKSATGHYPRMMLTEFCSWEGDKDGFVTNVDNQIDQMTQRVQKLELSDMIEGYAWFMANANAAEYPFMSVFQTNSPESPLSDLGKIYVHMSSFDRNKYFAPGRQVAAKDYVDATTDAQIVRIRPNSEEGSTIPLQITFSKAAPYSGSYSATTYQINVVKAGDYTFTVHAKAAEEAKLEIEVAGLSDKAVLEIAGNPGRWADYKATLSLPAGKHTLKISNLSETPVTINSWKYEAASGVSEVSAPSDGPVSVFSFLGTPLGTFDTVSGLDLPRGVYLIVFPDGSVRKTLI